MRDSKGRGIVENSSPFVFLVAPFRKKVQKHSPRLSKKRNTLFGCTFSKKGAEAFFANLLFKRFRCLKGINSFSFTYPILKQVKGVIMKKTIISALALILAAMCITASGCSCDGVKQTGTAYGLVDRKSTRLNSIHLGSSYAVFCLKKKK